MYLCWEELKGEESGEKLWSVKLSDKVLPGMEIGFVHYL